ncbi:sensor histidine kinase [uncultured Roseobacter sp.]|uniref:sensor histidine kinase n=1 Tax=uncultured Roseobacter sp. TaxID=114847 RepID=UPI0026241496|nr:sensor histidine kinase [uncultured Roseobacter sp.]
MTGGFLDGDVFRGLAFRILVFLSLALLPFGLIAVVQTREIAHQAQESTELSLLGLTERFANGESSIVQKAFGAADALSAVVPLFGEDDAACSAFLRAYQRDSGVYSMVGFIAPGGMMRCSSAGTAFDMAAYPDFDVVLSEGEPGIVLSRTGPISQQAELVMINPVTTGDASGGFMLLSVPLATIREHPDLPVSLAPSDLVTFNASGDVLSSERARLVTQADLPQNRSLTALVGQSTAVFEDENEAGAARVYAVVPIVPDVFYAMSIWRQSDVLTSVSPRETLSIFLPMLMWLASLVVAFWSINRLAIRYIRKLGRQMRLFAYNRAMPRTAMGPGAPREFIDIQQAFMGMAESIIRDEASLEDSLRQKSILLKEVHHRVKNNLQLISSIMNMQIRRAPTEEARRVLRRLQERILSLATVHKNLYQTDGVDRVDAGELMGEIIGQLLVVGLPAGSAVKVSQSYASVALDTDDAAPLTLLVSEAVTNAMKYIGEPQAGQQARLDIRLEPSGEEHALFTIRNTVGPARDVDGTGLGSQLINAFARQLNGQITSEREGDVHVLTLRFPVPHRIKPVHDY